MRTPNGPARFPQISRRRASAQLPCLRCHRSTCVRREEVPAAAASLVRAFYDDPLLGYLFPDPRTRGRALRRFFTLQLRQTPREEGACVHDRALPLDRTVDTAADRATQSSRCGCPDTAAADPRPPRRCGAGPRPADRLAPSEDAPLLPRRPRHGSRVAEKGLGLSGARSCARHLRPRRRSRLPRVL